MKLFKLLSLLSVLALGTSVAFAAEERVENLHAIGSTATIDANTALSVNGTFSVSGGLIATSANSTSGNIVITVSTSTLNTALTQSGSSTFAGATTFSGASTASGAVVDTSTFQVGTAGTALHNIITGSVALASGTATVTNSAVTATSKILFQRQAANASTTYGTAQIYTAGTGTFSVTSTATTSTTAAQTGDTSTFSYIIFN